MLEWSEENLAQLRTWGASLALKPGRKVATFDADGTLWADDVGEDFFRWLIAEGKLVSAGPADRYAAYEALLETDTAAAYASVATAMAGLEEADVLAWGRTFFETTYVGKVFAPQVALVKALESAGVEVWIVTASPRWIVQVGMEWIGLPASRVVGIDVAVVGGLLTDRVVGPITYRAGKVDAIDLRVRLRPVLASGNTMSDFEMLMAAEHAVVINPGAALSVEAQRRGWLVQRFEEAAHG